MLVHSLALRACIWGLVHSLALRACVCWGNAMTDRSFNTDDPLAYFLTWTTYGTWLPGDDRGWNRKGVPGTQVSNPSFRDAARARMKEDAFTLSTAQREIVERTIRKHCEIRKWRLHAVNARSNHVHVVVTAPGYKPKTVRDQFKAWCSRNLKQVIDKRTQFWTEGGSCRSINTEADLEAAIAYVMEAQDRKGVEDG